MRVVVGVDRSKGSRAALRFAFSEAAAHDAELLVVHAFEPALDVVHATDTDRVLRAVALQDASELLDEVLTHVRQERRWQVRRVTARPVEGEPAAVLTTAARERDLLVVGANRGGLVRRVLLGSVSSKVVQSARGPVVVVPATWRRSRATSRRPAGASRGSALSVAER